MIKNFRCKLTQSLFEGGNPKQFRAIKTVAERKLTQLHNAASLEFLNAPPANRLEKLKGNRVGYWSIRINKQYRLCFKWIDNEVRDVEIIDYH